MTFPDWIVLDTDVVRHTIAGHPLALDLAALERLKGDRPVSISEVAYVELMDDLAKGNVSV